MIIIAFSIILTARRWATLAFPAWPDYLRGTAGFPTYQVRGGRG